MICCAMVCCSNLIVENPGPISSPRGLFGPVYFVCSSSIEVLHVFGFGIEFLENKDISIFGHFIEVDLATILILHIFQLPDIVDLELGVLSVMVNGAYRIRIVSSETTLCIELSLFNSH